MNGGGYQNSGSMSDAKELQQLFSKGNKEKEFGGKSKRKATGSSNPMKRTEPFQPPQRLPPPVPSSSNVPPPSQRDYTETLLSDPLKRSPGAFLGQDALDFLRRNDAATKKPSGPIQEQNGNVVAKHPPTALEVPKPAPDPIRGQKEKVVVKLSPTASPVPKALNPPTRDDGFLRHLTINSSHSAIKTSTLPTVGKLIMPAQGPVTPVKKIEKEKNIVEIYFSMMDSDNESEGDLIAFEAKDETANMSNASIFLKYSSDELLKLRPNTVLPPDCIVKRGNDGEMIIVASSSSNTEQPNNTQPVPLASPQTLTPTPVESWPGGGVTQPTINRSYIQQVPSEPRLEASVVQQTSSKVDKPGIVQPVIETKTVEFQKAEEAAVPREIRGELEPSKRLRPQAPAFVPGSPGASLSSRETTRKPAKGLSASMWAK